MRYKEFLERDNKINSNIYLKLERIDEVIHYFKSNQVSIFKYHQGLETAIQSQTNYHAFMQLSKDGKEFIITNLRPYLNIDIDE